MPAKYYKPKKPPVAKPATTAPIGTTGQFAAGALTERGRQLSGTPTGNVPGGPTPSAGTPITTKFTQLPNGKIGSLIDLPVTDLNQQTPAFAAKYQQALAEQSQLPLTPQSSTAQQGTNFNNPQNPGVFGAGYNPLPAPPPFVPNAAQDARGTLMEQFRADLRAQNDNFNFVASFGNGNWSEGIKKFMSLPLLTGNLGKVAAVGGLAKKAMPAIITKDVLKGGGAKEFNTVRSWWSKLLSSERLVTYTNPATGASKQVLVRSMKIGTIAAIGGLLALGYSVVKDATGTGGIGIRDRLEELGGAVPIMERDFADDPEALDQVAGWWKDVKNAETSWLPFGIGSTKNAKLYADFVDRQIDIRRDYNARKDAVKAQLQAEGKPTGEFDPLYWQAISKDIEANKTAESEARNASFMESRLETERQIEQVRAQIRAARSDDDKATMQETAAFWLEYHRKLIEMEKTAREEAGKFWLEYRKMLLRLQEDSGRSRLGFGLLR